MYTHEKSFYYYRCGIYYFFQNFKRFCERGEKVSSEWIFGGAEYIFMKFQAEIYFFREN